MKAFIVFLAAALSLAAWSVVGADRFLGEITVSASRPNGDVVKDLSARLCHSDTGKVVGTKSLRDGYAVFDVRAAGTYYAEVLDRAGALKATSERVTLSDSISRAKIHVRVAD
jgi:hypothetical protein